MHEAVTGATWSGGSNMCATVRTRRIVRVDPHLCEGHALCLHTAGDVFVLSDDDVAVCPENPSDDLWDQIQAAVDACPRGAISVIEE